MNLGKTERFLLILLQNYWIHFLLHLRTLDMTIEKYIMQGLDNIY
jgi:hypothetical protein